MYGELSSTGDDPAFDGDPAITFTVVFHVAVEQRAVIGVPFHENRKYRNKGETITKNLLGGDVVVVVDAATISNVFHLFSLNHLYLRHVIPKNRTR